MAQRAKQASQVIFIVVSLVQEINFGQMALKYRRSIPSLTYTIEARFYRFSVTLQAAGEVK